MAKEEIENYTGFLEKLNAELAQLQQAGSFAGLKHIPGIIADIEKLQSDKLIPRAATLMKIKPEFFSKEVAFVIETYAGSFRNKKELLIHFKEFSGDFFTQKKGYQLSHARGILKSRIDKNEHESREMKHYFLSRIFIDAVETLPLILLPIVKRKASSGSDEYKWPSKTREAYQAINNHLGDGIIGKEKLHMKWFETRNFLSHGKILFMENHIAQFDNDKFTPKSSRRNVYNNMDLALNLLVVFATEIDLMLLKLAKPENADLFPIWMSYFKNYVEWFNKNLNVRTPNPNTP